MNVYTIQKRYRGYWFWRMLNIHTYLKVYLSVEEMSLEWDLHALLFMLHSHIFFCSSFSSTPYFPFHICLHTSSTHYNKRPNWKFYYTSKFERIYFYSTSLDAKHVQNKAARKANHNRPKKSRPSDINRKPVVYPSFEKPSEYTISDAPAAPVTKKSE